MIVLELLSLCVFPLMVSPVTAGHENEWRDSDGNILPAEEPQVSHTGERYDITLLTTVTRTNTNHFHCVATQEELSHRAADEIFVPDQLFESCRGDTVLIVSFVSGILSAVAVLSLCLCFLYTTA